jgi:hypothetical protein
MPPYQRLVLTRLETPTWTIPAPENVEEDERFDSHQPSLPATPCGVGSPYGAAESCGLDVDHDGIHKSVSPEGEITGTWPA